MHGRVMGILKNSVPVTSKYAPIMVALLQLSKDDTTRERMKHKFDIAYMIAKEICPFTKMKAMCELEEWHGAELGQGFKNDHACATFIEFIAHEQQEQLMAALSRSKFFSLQPMEALMLGM